MHSARSKRDAVVIIGTMGNLDAHILARLLLVSGPHSTYVLVQAESTRPDAETKPCQRDVFETHGLDVALLDSLQMVLAR